MIGQFRDADAPDDFVWLRGFRDMDARKTALTRFYDGPAWMAHRDEANATIIDSDNVLLLRPAKPGLGIDLGAGARRPRRDESPSLADFVVAIFHLEPDSEEILLERFNAEALPLLAELGAKDIATLVTERGANTFPRLPVRDAANVLASLARLERPGAFAEISGAYRSIGRSRDAGRARRRVERVEISRLQPTPRSQLR